VRLLVKPYIVCTLTQVFSNVHSVSSYKRNILDINSASLSHNCYKNNYAAAVNVNSGRHRAILLSGARLYIVAIAERPTNVPQNISDCVLTSVLKFDVVVLIVCIEHIRIEFQVK